MCQSKHTGLEVGHIQHICAAIVVAKALCRPYGHHDWQRLGMTICRHVVPIVVIKIVITIFFSSFNDVALSNSMFVDCCMLCCRECGLIAAVGCRRPPCSIDAKFASWRNRHLPLLFLLFRRHRNHLSLPYDVPERKTRRHDRLDQWAAEPMAPMPAMLLIVTSPDNIADFLVC